MRYCISFLFFLFSIFSMFPVHSAESINLALGKKYTLVPSSPNYQLCADAGDRVQLTDGKTTTSYFWTDKGTVGWQNVSYVEVVIDLGKVEPIDRVSFTSAAGIAGVKWPRIALALVSLDGKNFYKAGDLMSADEKRNGSFDNSHYSIRKIVSDPLAVKGRYVKLFLIGNGIFIFTDEIEVLRGSDDLLKKELTGTIYTSSSQMAANIRCESSIRKRYSDDTDNINKMIDAAYDTKLIDELNRNRMKAELNGIRTELAALPLPDSMTFKAILPYNPVHQKLFRIQADLWREYSNREFYVNANNCWEPLELVGRWPEKGPVQSHLVDLLRNETRYFTYLLYNASTEPRNVNISFSGKNFPAKNMTVSEVLWTDTKSLVPVATAISPISTQKSTGEVEVTVLPGIVKQLWFSVTSAGLQPGLYDLNLNFDSKAEARSARILLTVHSQEMPENASLMSGGWDYTAGNGGRDVNVKNIDNFIKICKEHRVNAPWAQSFVLLDCTTFDPQTKTMKIQTEAMEQWLARWKNSREYFVFLNVGNSFLGSKIGTPEFETKVAQWNQLWSDWLVAKGYDPKKFNLLLIDEPGIESQLKTIVNIYAWSKALKKASSGFRVWEDPVFAPPQKMPEELAACSDVYCPNRPQWIKYKTQFDTFYNGLRDKGKRLNLYSCSGPVRLYDTYHYYLLQAWHCFQIDAKASFFWAMGDAGGQSSWNEYLLAGNSYAPIFIDPKSEIIVPAKMIKAMQIGVQDYEVLLILKKEIEKAKKDPSRKAKAEHAQKILTESVEKVLKNCTFESLTDQKASTDRDQSDLVRRELLQCLSELLKP